MSKLKKWLCERFLPAYCRDAMEEENQRLEKIIKDYRDENARLRAYIEGMETAIRQRTRITINAKEVGAV